MLYKLLNEPRSKKDFRTALEKEQQSLKDSQQRIVEQEERIAQLNQQLEFKNKALEKAIVTRGAVRNLYMGMLKRQIDGTIELSEAMTTIRTGLNDIATAYKESLDSVMSISQTSHALQESIDLQNQSQKNIVAKVSVVHSSSEVTTKLFEELYLSIGKSKQIKELMGAALGTLNDLSARLNILSLNGLIEAARLGVAGKGFSVVAGEVRKLQDTTSVIIKEQEGKLNEFVSLIENIVIMSQKASQQIRGQQANIDEVALENRKMTEQTASIADNISTVTAAVDQLGAAIQEGQRTVESILTTIAQFDYFLKDEVYVSAKVNKLDAFFAETAATTRSLTGAAQKIINQYQALSVIEGKNYAWRGESWLCTSRSALPVEVQKKIPATIKGDRLFVCIGQTDNNPRKKQLFDTASGIIDVASIDDVMSAQNDLQDIGFFLKHIKADVEALRYPEKIKDKNLEHCAMSVLERFDQVPQYKQAISTLIPRAGLMCSFEFGGFFDNGDFIVNRFLANRQRYQTDGDKFSLLGISLVLALQELIDRDKYWG